MPFNLLLFGDAQVAAAPPTPPFSPPDPSNLKIWLKHGTGLFQDASKTTPVAANSDPVGCWADQSGNGVDFTAAGTARPLYKTNIAGTTPGILFDGSNDVLASAAFDTTIGAPGIGVGAYTLFLAIHGKVEGTAEKTVLAQGSFAPAFYSTGAAGKVKMYAAFSYNFTTALTDANHVLTFKRINGTTGPVTLWVDSAQDSFSTAADPSTWNSKVYSLGSNGAGGTFFNNYVYELMLWKGALSDTDRGTVESYLKNLLAI